MQNLTYQFVTYLVGEIAEETGWKIERRERRDGYETLRLRKGLVSAIDVELFDRTPYFNVLPVWISERLQIAWGSEADRAGFEEALRARLVRYNAKAR